MKPTRRLPLSFPVTLLAALACATLASAPSARAAGPADATPVDKATRGKYLVATAGCMDCHTPMKMGANGPEWDLSRTLAGHPQEVQMTPVPVLPHGPWLAVVSATNTAFGSPMGASFAANLTPDPDTGLGLWTEKDFRDTIRTGRHMGRGRPVLPPMPIAVYKNFTDEDLGAIYAYLRTIPPVKNRVPEPWGPPAAAAAQQAKP